TEEQFKEGYRKAQLIDVREPQEFEKGHILGARNIPLTQLRQRLAELRKDQPMYRYCAGSSRPPRAAHLLHNKSVKDTCQSKASDRQEQPISFIKKDTRIDGS